MPPPPTQHLFWTLKTLLSCLLVSISINRFNQGFRDPSLRQLILLLRFNTLVIKIFDQDEERAKNGANSDSLENGANIDSLENVARSDKVIVYKTVPILLPSTKQTGYKCQIYGYYRF